MKPIDITYNRAKEIQQFEDTKTGVKGLVDSGVTEIPIFFVHPPESLPNPPTSEVSVLELPSIDFAGAERGGERRREVVEEIRKAASTWGFFRMVNHGVPVGAMDAMLEATRRFHEQASEDKKGLYSGDGRLKVRFTSTVPTRESEVGCWRDILTCVFQDDNLDPQVLPPACRKETQEYVNHMIKLRETMAELLSEALGLTSDYLSNMECMKSEALACLYYPFCPQPNLTMGNSKHSDTTFLTVLLQDHKIGGLQILHQNQWVDVPPVHGTLIANIGDLMQTMAELLSEALGLTSDYLSNMECMKSEALACLYYPFCPQPNLTMGNSKHSDTTFLTVLLQDHKIGGLQILHQNQWADVPPVHGTLIANIGDLMQIISNDKFKSVEHRVPAQPIGPRISVACFFHPSTNAVSKLFGPIKELLSEKNPPIYREVIFHEYIAYYKLNYGLIASALPHYRLI